MVKTIEERIVDAERKRKAADMQLKSLQSKVATEYRKQDTRRKVIVGAVLIDLAQSGDEEAARVLDRAIRKLNRERDVTAFAGWTWMTEAKAS